jgi:hypothetical protein
MQNFADEVSFLVAQTGPLNGQRWAIRRNLVLGREPDCDIVIKDRQVSRHHAKISHASQGLSISDLKSKNGTHLNGSLLDGSSLLHDGDIIQIALAQKFIFLSSDSTVPLDSPELDWDTVANLQLETELELKRLRLDKRSRRVWVSRKSEDDFFIEEEILPPLSVSQYRLLEILYKHQGKVVSRPDLVAAVWGEKQAYNVSEQALDALVRRLRERIANIDPDQNYVVTVRGHGLRLDNPDRTS